MFSGARLRPSYANWGQLWSIMDNEGVTFPDIRDLQDFVAAPGVHSLVERTQFIKAAHYNFGDTQCILFTIDEGALSRPKPRYVAIGRVISQSVWKTILGLGSTSTATKWFNVSNYGEEQIGFLQRIFGLYDVEPLQTWKLQGKPFTISGLIADTVENYQYRPRSNLPGHTTNVAVAYRRLTWWEALLASLPSAQDDLDGAQVRKPEQVVTKVEVTRLGNAPLCTTLRVSADTPLDQVVGFFKTEANILDYTINLKSASSEECIPIYHSLLADVYKVTLSNGSQVAVKCLRHLSNEPYRNLKKSARELSTWSSLEDENILKLSGFAVFRTRLAMVSPWMNNGNVVQFLKDKPAAVRYTKIHGDLKGENIFVSHDGIVKVADFGLAIMRHAALEFSKSDPGGGTQRWMAPELLDESGAERSKEADMYALGMTILEIVTGQIPFNDFSQLGPITIYKIIKENLRPQRPDHVLFTSSVGESFWRMIESCWEHAPEARITAIELKAKMDLALQDYSTS